MGSFVTWRGQVPAWQCDAGGRWSLRHAAGAFEEAGRIAGIPSGELALGAGNLPRAGDIVEIRSGWSAGTLAHLMVRWPDGAALLGAAAPCRTAPPTPRQPADMPDTVPGPLGVVNTWECDVMGHMNVQFYAGRLTEAEAMLAAAPGVAGGALLRPVEHRFRFAGELKAGETVRAATARLGTAGLTARTVLAQGDGRVAALMESDLAAFSPAGEAVGLAEAVPGLDALPAAAASEPVWTAGDWAPDDAALARMEVLGRQEVAAWEVDHTGVMPPRFFLARMAGSVPYLLDRMGLERPYMLRHNLGRAAVGYRLRYLRWPRAGDCLELRSGVALVGRKNWRFRHCFTDLAGGAQVCTVEAVIVLLDLATRKSAPLPEPIRARAMSVSI